MDKKPCSSEESEVRKGPWTMEEDLILVNYIANHGEGVWNTLARSAGLEICSLGVSAGLKRTGKSCRLRWLNYLRPDVRRGNITPEEQLLIMELHTRWGNRWSKIARQLPGRTDNEIKNYWRTRIQKKTKLPTENCSYQYSMLTHDEAGSSQMSGVEYGIESCPPMYDAAATNAETYPGPSSADSNDSFWTEEELWSMQLFDNNDQIN